MATGSQGFDEGGVKRYNVVGASDACNGTDVPRSDLSENERAASGSDNFFVPRSVDDLIPSEYPSKVKSGPVLREHWKPSGLLSVGRSRLGFPDCHYDHLVQLLAPVVRKVDNAIHRTNHYPADNVVCFANTYPLDSDLSVG